MHKQVFQVPGLCCLNVSRHEKVNDFNPKWKAQYKRRITQFNAEFVLSIFSQGHEDVLSSSSVSLSWRKSTPEKTRVRDMKDIQKPVCFEMDYFIDYSFDFASA